MPSSGNPTDSYNVKVEQGRLDPLISLMNCQENYRLFTELCDACNDENRNLKQTPWQHNYLPRQVLKGSSSQVDTVESVESVQAPSPSLDPISTLDSEVCILEPQGPPPKRQKRESIAEISMNVSSCQVDISFSQRSDPLTQEDWDKVAELRAMWHGGKDADKTDLPNLMSLLCTATPIQVKEICCELKLDVVNEIGMLTACDDICEMGDKLGYSNSLHIITALILPKLEDTHQTSPRCLVNVMTRLCKQFPRQMIEGVISPRLEYTSIASSEVDIFCKMTRENFTETNRGYLLQKLLDVEYLSEGILCVIQVLIDLKILLQTADLVKLVSKLRADSIPQANNLKFAKLLFALITKYGNQMDKSLIDQIRYIGVENKTFLNKAITSAILKLERS